VEFDAGAELDAMECSEVVGAKIVGGTDLSSGRGRQMEYGRDGRHEFGVWAVPASGIGGSVLAGPARASRVRPADVRRVDA
jgi:hypothetical protein